jgi:hypothetical protein
MSSPRNRLVSYGFVLVGLFGTAYAVGERLPGHQHSSSDGHSHQHGTSDSTETAGLDLAGLGLSSAVGDYQLVVVERTSTAVALRIDRAGVPVVDFAEVHGALGHLLVVRRDLQGFQHLHPVLGPDGVWTATLDHPIDAGAWRAVLETEPSGGGVLVMGVDLLVGGEAAPVAVPPPSNVATVEGLTVARQGLWFTVTPSDSLQPWYGQSAHLVAFREGDLAYAHLHPANDVVGDYRFNGQLPGPGTYRLFLQFLAEGELVTAAFTVVEP